MKKNTLLCLFCLVYNLYNAQVKYTTAAEDFINYHAMISDGERMFKNDSFLQAYAKFDVAIQNHKDNVNPSHYYKAGISALKIKEEFKALYFLEKAITNGYDLDSTKSAQIVFYNQNTKNEYLANLKKWEDEGKANRNTTWENELQAQQTDVQKYKKNDIYGGAIRYCAQCLKVKTCSKTDSKYKYNFNLIKEKSRADSVVTAKLLNNIKQYGFPNLKLLSKKSCDAAQTILLNYNSDSKNEQLNDILFKALQQGEISPEFYATLIDQRNLVNGATPEFYQPITGYEKTIGKELNAVNAKRKTIGLYPIVLPNVKSNTKSKSLDKAGKPIKANAKDGLTSNLYDY